MSTEVEAGESDYVLKISEMSEKLAVFVGFLRDLNSKLISTIRTLRDRQRTVYEIDELIGNIRIHNDVDFVIGEVMSHLRDIVSDASTRLLDIEELREVLLPFHHIHMT